MALMQCNAEGIARKQHLCKISQMHAEKWIWQQAVRSYGSWKGWEAGRDVAFEKIIRLNHVPNWPTCNKVRGLGMRTRTEYTFWDCLTQRVGWPVFFLPRGSNKQPFFFFLRNLPRSPTLLFGGFAIVGYQIRQMRLWTKTS